MWVHESSIANLEWFIERGENLIISFQSFYTLFLWVWDFFIKMKLFYAMMFIKLVSIW
jgi:hypothetical protein